MEMCCCEECSARNHWGRLEYLLWWTKGNDLPPLVTTGTTAGQGVLGASGTQILFGDDQVDNKSRSGLRAQVGHWLDGCKDTGIQATYFGVFDDRDTGDFFAATTGPFESGTPILARPFFNNSPGVDAEDAQLISFPNTVDPTRSADGSINISSTSELHSGSVLLRQRYRECNGNRVDLLVGCRYLRYREGVLFQKDLVSTATGGLIPQGTTFSFTDLFAVRNDFHGGELGVRSEFQRCYWTLELLAKVALGNIQRTIDIDGRAVTTTRGRTPPSSARGILALPTNMVHATDNDFAALPELGVHVTYEPRNSLQLLLGYSLVMLTDVARTGEHIDSVLNAIQFAGGTLVGPARPTPQVGNVSDFWAHGLSFGILMER